MRHLQVSVFGCGFFFFFFFGNMILARDENNSILFSTRPGGN